VHEGGGVMTGNRCEKGEVGFVGVFVLVFSFFFSKPGLTIGMTKGEVREAEIQRQNPKSPPCGEAHICVSLFS